MEDKDFDTNAMAKDIIKSNLQTNNIPYEYFYFKLDKYKNIYITIVANKGVERRWRETFSVTPFVIETNVKIYR